MSKSSTIFNRRIRKIISWLSIDVTASPLIDRCRLLDASGQFEQNSSLTGSGKGLYLDSENRKRVKSNKSRFSQQINLKFRQISKKTIINYTNLTPDTPRLVHTGANRQ